MTDEEHPDRPPDFLVAANDPDAAVLIVRAIAALVREQARDEIDPDKRAELIATAERLEADADESQGQQ